MVAKRSQGEITVTRPYATKGAAIRTLKKLKATKTHRVVKNRQGLFTLRKIKKG